MTDQAVHGIREQVAPMITREVAGIAALDAAVARVSAPDYVVMFQAAKSMKQANVEQMVTLIRMEGGTPDESGGFRRLVMTTQATVAATVSTTIALRAMQSAEIELVTLYTSAVGQSDGLARTALRKALSRAMVRAHLLTAHLAQRTGNAADARLLPGPLADYFVGREPRACMRCHLDRPGTLPALERRDPHPFTYICAGCHEDVLKEFPSDLAEQVERWPREVREARVIQHAAGRVSKLNAVNRVLHPLAGLASEIPAPPAERALTGPSLATISGPAESQTRGTVTVHRPDGAEGEYVERLFSATGVWDSW
jgi:hypothetical protein